MRTNFYTLAAILNVNVKELFDVYKQLYPHIRILGYSVYLNSDEIKKLKEYYKNKKDN